MNFRIAISSFPPPGDPARRRMVAALSEATGLSVELLESRLDSSPGWLFEVPDRDEAEAWRALLSRQRGVVVATLPALGRPVPSYAESLPRARLALGGGSPPSGRPSAGGPSSLSGGRLDGAGRPSQPGAAERRRSITAPESFGPDQTFSAAGERSRAPASPHRGITAPVGFLGEGGSQPDTEPQVQSLSEMLEHEERSSEHPVPLAPLRDDDLELARRSHSRAAAPTVAPAGMRRTGIDVRVSTGQRVMGPLLRIGIPLALVALGVAAWRHFDRPVVNKPALAAIELLDEGRLPRDPLRYAPLEDTEGLAVGLSIEHRIATRQVRAGQVIDTIGGEGTLEIVERGEGYFDVKPLGRENHRGSVRLRPVRVLDVGHTGDLPTAWLPDVEDDDMPAMRAFARMLNPPYVQLPVEPVGPGARWRYRYAADQSPLGLETVVEVELLGRDERRLELGLKLTVPPKRDPGEAASGYQRIGPFFGRFNPPVRIFDFAGVGEGRATVNLGRVTPIALDVAVQFAARMEAHTDFGQQLIEYSPVISLKIGED